MNENKETNDWKNKFQDLLNICQSEIKKTTKLGMKMINASQANSRLHEKYEELGRIIVKAMDNKEIVISLNSVDSIVKDIKELETELNKFEDEVQEIKKEN